jgi:sarcosine oxidase subunit delta
MRIPCPYCGPRDSAEFSYGGDATRVRPDIDDADPERWLAYVYERDNPKGPHKEFWHHLHGCRQWLVVTRNTLTHEISGTAMARDAVRTRQQGASK